MKCPHFRSFRVCPIKRALRAHGRRSPFDHWTREAYTFPRKAVANKGATVRLANLGRVCLSASACVVGLVFATPGMAGAAPKSTFVPCTGQQALIDAINAANASGGGTLNLTPGCTYQLTTVNNSGENGLPIVVTPIAVNGNGATIDGTGTVRDVEVDGPRGSLSTQNLTLTGGSAQDFGGALANLGGSVVLSNTWVTNNSAVVAGGGIASATMDPSSVARLTLNNTWVTGNQQTLAPSPTNMALGGGGIVNVLGTATLNGSTVNNNTAQGFVGGGIANGDYFNFSSSASVLTLNHSAVNDNTAPNAGGGGVQNVLGSVTANSSTVNGNTALNGGGISSGNGAGGANPPPCTAEIQLNNSQVNGNTATAPAPTGPGQPPFAAGGVANGCNAVINNTQVDGNKALHTSGGGIVNHGTMQLNKSEVKGNMAQGSGPFASGGGIVNVNAGPISGATDSGVLTVNNSQVNGNNAGGQGGGIANGFAFGTMGGLPGGAVTMNHSQVIGNTAAHGGGISNNGGSVTLNPSTTVGPNTPDNCEPLGTIPGCTG